MNIPAENIAVIYHAHCPDGFGAAYAAWKALGPKVQYIPLRNGASPPELDPATRMYILDLSFSRDRMLGEGGPAALIFEQTGGSPPPLTKRSSRS